MEMALAWTQLVATILGMVLIWKQIIHTHNTFNSKMDAYHALIKESSFAKGAKSETDKHRGDRP
jgi:hypothetical protein